MNILYKLKNNYWLLAILVLGSMLRFYHIDFQSIWLMKFIQWMKQILIYHLWICMMWLCLESKCHHFIFILCIFHNYTNGVFSLLITSLICGGISTLTVRVSSTTSKNLTGCAVSKKMPCALCFFKYFFKPLIFINKGEEKIGWQR